MQENILPTVVFVRERLTTVIAGFTIIVGTSPPTYLIFVNPMRTVRIIHIRFVNKVLRTTLRKLREVEAVFVKVVTTELTKVNEEFKNIGSWNPAKSRQMTAFMFVLKRVVEVATLPLITVGIVTAVVTTVSSRRKVKITTRLNPGPLPMLQTSPTAPLLKAHTTPLTRNHPLRRSMFALLLQGGTKIPTILPPSAGMSPFTQLGSTGSLSRFSLTRTVNRT